MFDAVYGEPVEGHRVIAVDADLALVFAEAHRRLRRRPVAVHFGGGTLDLVGPEPHAGDRWVVPGDEVIDAVRSARNPVLIAGPGVLDADAVPGLHALSAAASLGVLNTWGAKGVFDWRSRHHLATVGLQERDFERGGLAEADLVIGTGLDPAEMRATWRLAPSIEVSPLSLGPLAEVWSRPRSEIAVPELRADLAKVTQEGWSVDAAPMLPTRLTRNYSLALGGGLVAADAGVAGYWIARTFGTTGIGGAQVPSSVMSGFAIACAVVPRMLEPQRSVLAVVDEFDDYASRVVEAGKRLGVNVGVEVWSADGERIGAVAHAARLGRLAGEGGVATIGFDTSQLDAMLDVAGPIVAWTD